jgi:hypothetical protein
VKISFKLARLGIGMDSIIGPFSQALLSFSNLAQAILLANLLGLSEYGRYAVILAVFATLSSGDFGYGNTAITNLDSNPVGGISALLSLEFIRLRAKYIFHLCIASMATAIFLLVALVSKYFELDFGFLAFIKSQEFSVILAIYLASIVSPVIGVFKSYLLINKKSYELLTKQIMGSLLALIVLYAYELLADINVGVALLVSLVFSQLFLLGGFFKLLLRLRRFSYSIHSKAKLDKISSRKLGGRILRFYLLAISASVSTHMHVFLANYLFDEKTVGALFLLYRIYLFGSSINLISFNNFIADVKNTKNIEELNTLIKMQLVKASANAVFSLMAIAFSFPLLSKLLPELSSEFINLTSILVFSFYVLITVPVGTLSSLCNAYGKIQIQLTLSMVIIVVTIALSLIGARNIGFLTSILIFTTLQTVLTIPILSRYLYSMTLRTHLKEIDE